MFEKYPVHIFTGSPLHIV